MLRLSTAYGMVVETLDWLQTVAGIEVLVVPVRFPMQDTSQVVDAVRIAIKESPGIALAIFSHITSVVSILCGHILNICLTRTSIYYWYCL